MNRRLFTFAALASPTALLVGCDSEPKPDHTATLLNNPAVHSAFKNLDDVLQNVEGDVDSFETTNWRDVVPNVKDGVAELRDGLQQLKRALGYSDAE